MKCLMTFLLTGMLATGCMAQSCADLPASFPDYGTAQALVLQADFPIDEEADTSRSSWIEGARYLSCDGQTGFFLLQAGGRTYLHQDVPRTLWEGFRQADSMGSYYNRYLKGRYRLRLE